MITLKLKYHSRNDIQYNVINEYVRQYSVAFKFFYNRIVDSDGSIAEPNLRNLYPSIRNIPLIDNMKEK